MMFTKSSKVDRSVVASASHLNNKVGPWWKDRGLRNLNLLLLVPLMSEFVPGYDASLINNVQQLTVWQTGEHYSPCLIHFESRNNTDKNRIPPSSRLPTWDSQR